MTATTMKSILSIGVLLTLLAVGRGEIKDDSASNALNLFGLKFLAETSSRIPETMNLAISPYTVWVAMSIVNEGARGNTAAELERTLNLPTNASDRQRFRKLQQSLIRNIAQKYEGVSLEVLNSLFTRMEAILNQDYVNLVRDIYQVHVQSLDFNNGSAAAQRINQLISDATRGRISQVVNAEDVKSSYMFITSALFFKGQWDKKFDKKDTKDEPFYNEQKQEIGTVQMMRTHGAFPFGQILDGKAIAVELPYIGNKMSMVAVLPALGVPLSSILNALANVSVSDLIANLNKTRDYFSVTDVMVQFPKFKISSTLELTDDLKKTGVRNAFRLQDADLSGISQTPLCISQVVHKAEIEVNEEGTVGSSVTVAEITDRFSDVEYFKANRPFVFIVFDKVTKSIVFAGRFASSK